MNKGRGRETPGVLHTTGVLPVLYLMSVRTLILEKTAKAWSQDPPRVWRMFSPPALNTSSTSGVKSVPLCISYPFIPWKGSESKTCCVMWGWLPKADFF